MYKLMANAKKTRLILNFITISKELLEAKYA